MIHFACPRCRMQLSAPEDCAGRSSKCRQCGQPITVPQPVAVAVSAIPPPPTDGRARRIAIAAAGAALVSLVLCGGCITAVVFWMIPRTNLGGATADFDPNDLERTAEWAKSLDKRLDESQQAGNEIRYEQDMKAVASRLTTHKGKEVRWRFRVKLVERDSVELDRTWSVPVVFQPEINRALDKAPGEKTGLVVFSVAFYQPVPDLDARHSTGEEIVRWQMEKVRGDSRRSLRIGADISPKSAARLSPGDFITVRGKVRSLAFGGATDTLYMASNHAIQCILSEVSVAE